jgi:chromate reductase, NAD(P)H dehydrogenase (quinone)
MKNKHILAFSGSNWSKSINQKLLVYASTLITKCKVRIISLRDYPAPLYSMDIEMGEGIPEKMRELNSLFNEHDAFLLALPEHNGSMTPVFKNTVDWLSRIELPVFRNKPVCLLSTSPGLRGAAHNREHITGLMPFWGGRVISSHSVGTFQEKWDEQQQKLVHGEDYRKLLETIRIFEKEICQ